MEDKTVSGLSAIYVDETVFDGQSEQGVELDHVLPDYCPDIFRILSCTFTPGILSAGVSGDLKLNLEGSVGIKVLYLTENSPEVFCVDQKYTYSKVIDMGKNLSDSDVDSAAVKVDILPKTDYCSCRAVSSRRLDIRGAVSCHIRASAPVKHPVFNAVNPVATSEAESPTKQVNTPEIRTREISCCGKTLFAEKQIVIREEIDTGAAGIGFILESNVKPSVNDIRIVADKAVVKGAVSVNALYGLPGENSSGCSVTEKMTADIPVSAILDIEGISDRHISLAELNVMNYELSTVQDSGLISAEMLVRCSLKAVEPETVTVADDVYSVYYEIDITTSSLKVLSEPGTFSGKITVKSSVPCGENGIRSVWDCNGILKNPSCRYDPDNGFSLTGTLFLTAYGTDNNNTPFYIEKQEPVEQTIQSDIISGNAVTDFSALPVDISFTIKNSDTLEINTGIEFHGVSGNSQTVEAVTAVNIREDKPRTKETDYSLRICYTNPGEAEDVWEIAKRYGTTVKALMESNGIEDSSLPLSGMIIIPTV